MSLNQLLRWLFAVMLGGSLIACLRDDEPSAEEVTLRDAIEELLIHVTDRDYGAVWESLHPAYQAIIDREQLLACGEQFPPVFASFEVIEVEMTEYQADELGEVMVWDVDVRFQTTEAFQEAAGTDVPIVRRLLWIDENDRWRWFPSTGEFQTFQEGYCGGMPWPAGSTELAEP